MVLHGWPKRLVLLGVAPICHELTRDAKGQRSIRPENRLSKTKSQLVSWLDGC
jgi:hypothetical protein